MRSIVLAAAVLAMGAGAAFSSCNDNEYKDDFGLCWPKVKVPEVKLPDPENITKFVFRPAVAAMVVAARGLGDENFVAAAQNLSAMRPAYLTVRSTGFVRPLRGA
jgi:hypothetical protein